jgi:hypothetical protein
MARRRVCRAAHHLSWWLTALLAAMQELCDDGGMETSLEMASVICRMECLREDLVLLRAVWRPRLIGGPFKDFDAVRKRLGLRPPAPKHHPACGIQSYAPFGDERTAKQYAWRLARVFVGLVSQTDPVSEIECLPFWTNHLVARRAGDLFYALFLEPLLPFLEEVEQEARIRMPSSDESPPPKPAAPQQGAILHGLTLAAERRAMQGLFAGSA